MRLPQDTIFLVSQQGAGAGEFAIRRTAKAAKHNPMAGEAIQKLKAGLRSRIMKDAKHLSSDDVNALKALVKSGEEDVRVLLASLPKGVRKTHGFDKVLKPAWKTTAKVTVGVGGAGVVGVGVAGAARG